METINNNKITPELELTVEEQAQADAIKVKENKSKFNDISRFINSDKYEKLVKKYKSKWDKLEKKIIDIVIDRVETKWTKSELDKVYSYIPFLKELKGDLWASKWEKILKEM